MTTYANGESAGTVAKKSRSAVMPPADAPSPTTSAGAEEPAEPDE
jgi:hypothetical protein